MSRMTLLSMRDEEIVLRAQMGERAEDTAERLGHSLSVVLGAYSRARALGIPITPHHAAPADRRDRRTTWN